MGGRIGCANNADNGKKYVTLFGKSSVKVTCTDDNANFLVKIFQRKLFSAK